MKILGMNVPFLKSTPEIQKPVGDVQVDVLANDMFKGYIPGFLYKPPYGYPRPENLILIRNLAKNPYVYSVIKTLQDEAASTDFDIVYKKDVEESAGMDKVREEILDFFDNPNLNKESFSQLLRKCVKDICEVDSGIIVKVFNRRNALSQLFSYDGASFLINPDIHGYIGNRADIVPPMEEDFKIENGLNQNKDSQVIQRYDSIYRESAAYFQYGFTGNALPVPFGKREVIYMLQNPRSDSIYGVSPIAILADIILSLVYGANYNLDFYMNNNMPEGVLEVLGADENTVRRIREHLSSRVQKQDTVTGNYRRVGFKIPVVNAPTKFTPFNLDPQVMQVIEQQQWFSKLVWASFGVSPDEMGFTESSNRAVGQVQHTIFKRKAVKPILQLIKYHIDKEIIPEWGEEAFKSLEFKWNDYDLDEDLKKHQLYQMQITMGLKSPEMICEEEGIDYADVKKYQEEKMSQEKEMIETQNSFKGNNPDVKAKKDITENTVLEETLVKNLKEREVALLEHLEKLNTGSISNIN